MEESTDIVARLKEQYQCKIISVVLDGKLLCFKPMNKAKLGQLKRQIGKSPDLELDLSINAVKFQCVHGKEDYDALADAYPIAMVGSDGMQGVLSYMIEIAKGDAQISVE